MPPHLSEFDRAERRAGWRLGVGTRQRSWAAGYRRDMRTPVRIAAAVVVLGGCAVTPEAEVTPPSTAPPNHTVDQRDADRHSDAGRPDRS